MAARKSSKVNRKYKLRRGWRKLHIGVDGGGFIVAGELTKSDIDDASMVPKLLESNTHLERIKEIGRQSWHKESGYRQQARAENMRSSQPDVRAREAGILCGHDVSGRTAGSGIVRPSVHAPTPCVTRNDRRSTTSLSTITGNDRTRGSAAS